MSLFIGFNKIEPMGLKQILPQPITTRAVPDGLTLTLAIPPGAHNAEVGLDLKPQELGPNQLIAQLAGHAPIRWTQFVLPRTSSSARRPRTASMMAPYDLIVLFLFAGALMAGVRGDDHSMTAAVSAVFAIGLMHISVSNLKRWQAWFGRLVDGTPVVIYEHGDWHQDRTRGLHPRERRNGRGAVKGADAPRASALCGRGARWQGLDCTGGR